MIKKLIMISTVFIIFALSSMVVYAGNTEGVEDTDSPVYNSIVRKSNFSTDLNIVPETDSTKSTSNENPEAESSDAAQKTVVSDDKAASSENGIEKAPDPDAEFNKAVIKVLMAGKPVDNGQFIMTVTKPINIEAPVSLSQEKLELSGLTEYIDVQMIVAKLNIETGMYEIIENSDGEKITYSRAGAISTEFKLESGENNLLLISYRASEKEESKIQYNSILISAKKETFGQKIIKAKNDFLDWIAEKFK